MSSTDPFEAIVDEHYEPLYRFAMSLTRSESDAGDLAQQTFYIWARKGHQLRDLSKVKTWLFTTLHREFVLGRRRQHRFPQSDLETSAAELPPVTPVFADRLDWSQVLAALAKVDEVFQPAVALFYLEDCPYKEIADILEVPVGTVKSRIARGIAQLREILLPGEQPASTPVPGGQLPRAIANETTVCSRRADALTADGTIVPLSPGNYSAFNDS